MISEKKLSPLEINELSEAVLANTKDLLNTGEILLDNGKNSHAGFFCIVAHEELIKYFLLNQLVGIMQLREPNWKKFWKLFKDHAHKLETNAIYDFVFCMADESPTFPVLSEISKNIKIWYEFLGLEKDKLERLIGKIQKQNTDVYLLGYQLLRSTIPILKVLRENFLYVGFQNEYINAPFLHEQLHQKELKAALGFLKNKHKFIQNFHDEVGRDFICNFKLKDKEGFLKKINVIFPNHNPFNNLLF